jgi:hypothetical protein
MTAHGINLPAEGVVRGTPLTQAERIPTFQLARLPIRSSHPRSACSMGMSFWLEKEGGCGGGGRFRLSHPGYYHIPYVGYPSGGYQLAMSTSRYGSRRARFHQHHEDRLVRESTDFQAKVVLVATLRCHCEWALGGSHREVAGLQAHPDIVSLSGGYAFDDKRHLGVPALRQERAFGLVYSRRQRWAT